MTSTYPSFLERAEFVAEIIRAYRFGRKVDQNSLFQRAYELWPCSHRISTVLKPDNVKCIDEEIRKRLLKDDEFLDSTYTSHIYWNSDEAIVGKIAVAAGLTEVAANSIESSTDLLAADKMLRNLFQGIALPFLGGDYSNEYEDQPGHWVYFVTSLEPADAMIHLFHQRIYSIEDDEVWSQEKKDSEFRRLSGVLEEYEGNVCRDPPMA